MFFVLKNFITNYFFKDVNEMNKKKKYYYHNKLYYHNDIETGFTPLYL